jgi:hypothetical protein
VASYPALATPASRGALRRLQRAARLLLGPLAHYGPVPDATKLAQAGFYFDGDLQDKTYFLTFFQSLRYTQTLRTFFTFQLGKT